jgi:hypothetical protein
MPPTIDDFIELLAAYGLTLQVGASPTTPTGNIYTVTPISEPYNQRYGSSADLATLQRQVFQKLRQETGDDNTWLAVMRSAYGNINLGVDDIPIARATQGELDDALSGRISWDEDEELFGRRTPSEADEGFQLLGEIAEREAAQAQREAAQDTKAPSAPTGVPVEDQPTDVLPTQVPPTTGAPPIAIDSPPKLSPEDRRGQILQAYVERQQQQQPGNQVGQGAGMGTGLDQYFQWDTDTFPLGLHGSLEEAEAQKALDSRYARGVIIQDPATGMYGITFPFPEEREPEGLLDYDIIDIGGVKYIRTARGISPLQTATRPQPPVASSVDQLIAAAFARGDTDRAEELWNFKNQPTDSENYAMALRFAESDADAEVIKQWFDIFTGGGRDGTGGPQEYQSPYMQDGGFLGGRGAIPLGTTPEQVFATAPGFDVGGGISKFPGVGETITPEISAPTMQEEDETAFFGGNIKPPPPGSPGYKMQIDSQPTPLPKDPHWLQKQYRKEYFDDPIHAGQPYRRPVELDDDLQVKGEPTKFSQVPLTPAEGQALGQGLLRIQKRREAAAQEERWKKLMENRKRFKKAPIAATYRPMGKGMGVS